jgi:hypothetical protein
VKRAQPLFALCLGFAALPVQAADAPPPGDFAADFVQTRTLPGFSAPLISHGKLRVDHARGFRWEITSPYHYVFEMNGKAADEELPDGTSRHLDPDQTPWLAAVEHIFVSALAGNRTDLERYFTITVTPTAGGQLVLLNPKPGPMASAIVSIRVTETSPGHPERLVIAESSGGSMEIRFSPETRAASGP